MARRNGSTNTAPASAEQATEIQTSASDASQETPADDTTAANDAPATEQPGEQEPQQGEPGPEDFARHTGARLVADHEHDLRLQEEVTDRLKRRGHEIATRLRKSGPNATVIIGGKEHVARQRPANSGGGMLLAEVSARTPTALA